MIEVLLVVTVTGRCHRSLSGHRKKTFLSLPVRHFCFWDTSVTPPIGILAVSVKFSKGSKEIPFSLDSVCKLVLSKRNWAGYECHGKPHDRQSTEMLARGRGKAVSVAEGLNKDGGRLSSRKAMRPQPRPRELSRKPELWATAHTDYENSVKGLV